MVATASEWVQVNVRDDGTLGKMARRLAERLGLESVADAVRAAIVRQDRIVRETGPSEGVVDDGGRSKAMDGQFNVRLRKRHFIALERVRRGRRLETHSDALRWVLFAELA